MSSPPSPTLSDSELLDSLADDPRFDLSARREELQHEIKAIQLIRENEYGRVVTYTDEKGLIERMAKDKLLLVHFFHEDFSRCQIMDRKLDEIAPRYPHTLFLRTSVANTPFLISKFGVKMLPCVLVFVDGKCVDRLVGFGELGDTDAFTTKTLEWRLKQSGALPAAGIGLVDGLPSSLLDTAGGSDDDDDEDEGRWSRGGKTGIRNGLASSRYAGDD